MVVIKIPKYRLIEANVNHISHLGEIRDEIENISQTFYDEDDIFITLEDLNGPTKGSKFRAKTSHKLGRQEFL